MADATWPKIVEHCGIDYMREQSKAYGEQLEVIFEGGGQKFFNKGTNGRWKDVLSQEEIDRCDENAIAAMGEECAHWLKTGELKVNS